MFNFFSKKNFLVDYLEGFVDIHNHILPGIDDGAKTAEESIGLIKGFSQFGVKDFIATPHIMHNYYDNTPVTINTSLQIVKDMLFKNAMRDISIRAAAEHMIDDNFEAILENEQLMPLDKYYLLVEMSYLQPSINFEDAISKIISKGYFPILAHPERYLYFHKDFKKYKQFKNQGILFQLNLLSLSNYYGKEVQQMANKLIDEKLIDFVASDVHNQKQLNSLKEIKIKTKLLNQVIAIIERTNQTF